MHVYHWAQDKLFTLCIKYNHKKSNESLITYNVLFLKLTSKKEFEALCNNEF